MSRDQKPPKKRQESSAKKQGKRKISKGILYVETKRMNVLSSVGAVVQPMEMVEINITSATSLMQARNRSSLPTTNPAGPKVTSTLI